jgi:hypothetical protein
MLEIFLVSVLKLGLVISSIALAVSYAILSLGKLDVSEIGYMYLWGRPIKIVDPGPYIALLGIYQVKKELKTFYQDELPAEPEKIYTGDGQTPDGMFLPIRIKFGQPDGTLKDDPYDQPMVVEVTPVVQWYICDLNMFRSTIGTVEECRKSLSDKAIEVLNDRFAQMSPAKALLDLAKVSEEYEKELRAETAAWGIMIKNAYVKPFNFSHKLNMSVVGVASATQDAKTKIITAEADKKAGILDGEKIAKALSLKLKAERENTKALAKMCKTSEGQIVLWINTYTEALKNAKYSIIPGSELFASVAGVKEMLSKIQEGAQS